MPSTRRAWTCAEKKKILDDFAIRLGNGESIRSISILHGIDPAQYRRWNKNKVAICSAKKTHKSVTRGRRSRIRHLEQELVQWMLHLREQGIAIDYKFVIERVTELDDDFAVLSSSQQYATVRRFCRSNCMVIRAGTHTAQVLPQDTIDQAIGWIQQMRPIFNAPDVDRQFIINMDQTPVFFSQHPNRTLHLQGERTINIRASGYAKSRITASLAITASGHKLKPMAIFQGERQGRIATREFTAAHPNAAQVSLCCQPSAWQDEKNMLQWIETCLVPYLEEKPADTPAFLLLDHFSVHWTANVQNRLEEIGVACHRIPPGCTGLVQPIDVGIGKPFKDRLKQQWSEWMRSLDADSRIPAARRNMVVQWLVDSWETITPQIAQNAWKKSDLSYFQDNVEVENEN
jgi:DDE superfamily endonuclease